MAASQNTFAGKLSVNYVLISLRLNSKLVETGWFTT